MSMIQRGVKLRPVSDKPEKPPSNSHIEQLTAALTRINHNMNPPDEQSDTEDMEDEFDD